MKRRLLGPLQRVMAAELCGTLGWQMVSLALLDRLVLAGEGGAGTLLGISVALQAPSLLTAPLAGPYLDRMGPARSLFVLTLFRGVLMVLLAACWSCQWFSLLALALISLFSALSLAARSALLPQVAGNRSLLQANGAMLRLGVAGGLLGPPLAGQLALWLGAGWCLAGAGVGNLAATLLLLALPVRTVLPVNRQGWTREFVAGYRLLAKEAPLAAGLRVLVLSSWGAGIMNFAVPLFFKFKGLDVGLYGVTMGGFALGQMGATFLLKLSAFKHKGLLIPGWIFFMQGVGMAALLWAGNPFLLVTVFMAMGLGSGAGQVILDSFFQRNTMAPYRGRLMAFTGACRGGCYLLAGVAGAVLSVLGATFLILLAALSTAACGLRLVQGEPRFEPIAG